MKKENILKLGSILGMALIAGQASADVSGYASNTKDQTINVGAGKYLDLTTSTINQTTKFCRFNAGPAAVLFSAETTKRSGGNTGWLNTRIWLDPLGPGPGFWLSPTDQSDNYAMQSAKGIVDDWQGHAVHGGFRAPRAAWYRVRVHARSTNGNAVFRIDDTSLICMN